MKDFKLADTDILKNAKAIFQNMKEKTELPEKICIDNQKLIIRKIIKEEAIFNREYNRIYQKTHVVEMKL